MECDQRKVKRKMGKLTDDDLTEINGKKINCWESFRKNMALPKRKQSKNLLNGKNDQKIKLFRRIYENFN